MSRKGDCWDNACAESYFHSLKVELIHGDPLQDRKQIRDSFLNISKWIAIATAAIAQLALLALSGLKQELYAS